jgi:hypothetical protein
MAKAPAKKVADKQSETPDYFKLPFEVYYSDHVAVTMLEFKSDIDVKKFEDVKIVHREQGGSWGLSFYCENNNGPELYCCINNLHDEVVPEWLNFLDEGNIEFNSGDNLSIDIDGDKISFSGLSIEQEDEDCEEFLDVDNMDACCSWTFLTYEIGDSCPDYIILDAEKSRLKVNLEGFVLNEEGEPTDEQVFDPDELDEDEFDDYTRLEMWQAKEAWVKSVLEKDFPKQVNLSLAYHTE